MVATVVMSAIFYNIQLQFALFYSIALHSMSSYQNNLISLTIKDDIIEAVAD